MLATTVYLPVSSNWATMVPSAVISFDSTVPASMPAEFALAMASPKTPSKKAYFTLATSAPSLAAISTLPSAGSLSVSSTLLAGNVMTPFTLVPYPLPLNPFSGTCEAKLTIPSPLLRNTPVDCSGSQTLSGFVASI